MNLLKNLLPPASDPDWRTPAIRLLYLVAGVMAFGAVVWSPAGTTGSDFDPIWNAVDKYVHGRPVYDEDYSTLDPHYLYSPGATFLLGPIGWLPGRDIARTIMMWLGAASIFSALWLLAASVAARYRGQVFAVLVIVACTFNEPVRSTLSLTNINGFLFLLQVLFALLTIKMLRRGWRASLKSWVAVAAGIILGVAMTIKPQFLALAVVSLLSGHITVLVVAGVFMAVVFLAGWLTMARPQDYVDRLLPYLGQARDYNNGSIEGVGRQLGWSEAAITGSTVAFLVVVALSLVALWRYKSEQPVVWVYCSLGVLFAGVLMTTGLMQGYYCIWLLPVIATVVIPGSPARTLLIVVVWWCLVSSAAPPEGLWAPAEAIIRWRSSLAWVALPLIMAGMAYWTWPSTTRTAPRSADVAMLA
ncbi:glycosyltransferase family 87 protein [Corynebacterium aurimucosum]|uniref:glycosyltransferase family 87 protein n=1 Tax=unclassified Corynebacterium TaxID=2624378 RepID=UPI0008A2CCEB|nr:MULTISPECIES: glycosyltransferase family 87 protein [unclassified Corynebacterium]OFQ34529.1 hypothetical protein HMPREF2943_01005 [Corynebacterium sp. HMSC072D12]OFS38731.1 hypothetical protein HMPREF2896_07705 [Corynebacterium sp. HMSC069E04]